TRDTPGASRGSRRVGPSSSLVSPRPADRTWAPASETASFDEDGDAVRLDLFDVGDRRLTGRDELDDDPASPLALRLAAEARPLEVGIEGVALLRRERDVQVEHRRIARRGVLALDDGEERAELLFERGVERVVAELEGDGPEDLDLGSVRR